MFLAVPSTGTKGYRWKLLKNIFSDLRYFQIISRFHNLIQWSRISIIRMTSEKMWKSKMWKSVMIEQSFLRGATLYTQCFGCFIKYIVRILQENYNNSLLSILVDLESLESQSRSIIMIIQGNLQISPGLGLEKYWCVKKQLPPVSFSTECLKFLFMYVPSCSKHGYKRIPVEIA